MRDLSDRESPYRGQYEEWDVWCFEHARDLDSEAVMAYYRGEAPEGWELLFNRVDVEGFVVPQRLSWRQQLERQHDPNYTPEVNCVFTLRGGGTPDAVMIQELNRMKAVLRAGFVPPIPAWLADAPPKWALLMPDGEVVAWGPLGQGGNYALPSHLQEPWSPEEAYYRYSADGTLLGQTRAGARWYELYFTGYEQLAAEIEDNGWVRWECNGYLMLSDPQTRRLLAVYDYTGEELPLGTDVYGGRRARYHWFVGADIPLIYEAQQRSEE